MSLCNPRQLPLPEAELLAMSDVPVLNGHPHAHAHAHAHSARTHARTRTHAHTHAHTRARAHMLGQEIPCCDPSSRPRASLPSPSSLQFHLSTDELDTAFDDLSTAEYVVWGRRSELNT
eukprot:6021163-Pleurochrysis_carterae.AAC.1